MSARITVDRPLVEFAIWALRKSNYLECANSLEAALSTEPGEAALHYECASAGCERPATVHFIRADVGSYYCRECYMRIQALPAAPLPEDTHHGR